MISAIGQVRVVAVWYALLGALCTLGAVVVITVFLAHREHEFGGLGIGLWIYICAGTAFWTAAVLSLRYLTLGTAIRNAALALSILLACCVIFAAVGVTLSGWNGRGVIVMWWGVAAVCALCSLLLWLKRRASNNRWRGRERPSCPRRQRWKTVCAGGA
jgi:hypothetical protein